MDVDRFLELPATADGRRVVTLMADPSMTAPDGTPAGFLSLVDKGANLRRFQVVKAEDLAPNFDAAGDKPGDQAWLGRFLEALGLGSLVAKVLGRKDAAAPLTFDAAITAERLRRTRWEATDALWDVIANVMASDLADKPGAIGLALDQFKATVMGLVVATMAAKSEDQATVLAVLEVPPDRAELAAKAGRVISAANMGRISAARDAMAAALTALDELAAAGAPPATATKADQADPLQEDPVKLTPAQLQATADAAAQSAIKAAKAAGVTDPAVLARVGAEASATVFKAAVMGPAQPSMPTGVLEDQIGQSGGMNGNAQDPLTLINSVLGQVASLATKVQDLTDTIKGKGEGETREPGVLEVATKAAELAGAAAERVRKLEGTPAAPRGAGDPPVTARKGADADPWGGSPLDFGAKAKA